MYLFFNNDVVLVKDLNIIIFQGVHVCVCMCVCVLECNKVIAVSIGPYLCMLCTIWTVSANCRLFDVMQQMCFLNLNSNCNTVE